MIGIFAFVNVPKNVTSQLFEFLWSNVLIFLLLSVSLGLFAPMTAELSSAILNYVAIVGGFLINLLVLLVGMKGKVPDGLSADEIEAFKKVFHETMASTGLCIYLSIVLSLTVLGFVAVKQADFHACLGGAVYGLFSVFSVNVLVCVRRIVLLSSI